MKLVCPSCGTTASAEIWSNDATCREAILAIASLPAPLHLSTLRYLTLFRPVKTALSWKKVLRIVGEVNALAQAGYVSIQGQIDRNCPARIWASAMDEMLERQTAIKRPLKNHNYLRQVAWGLADADDKAQEKNSEASHHKYCRESTGPVSLKSINPLAHLMED